MDSTTYFIVHTSGGQLIGPFRDVDEANRVAANLPPFKYAAGNYEVWYVTETASEARKRIAPDPAGKAQELLAALPSNPSEVARTMAWRGIKAKPNCGMGDCPLALYLQSEGIADARVGSSDAIVGGKTIPLPQHLKDFVRIFDTYRQVVA